VTEEQRGLYELTKNRICELGLESRVTLLNNIAYSEMPELYAASDLFVLPASDEPAGIVVLEAISQGVPAICSDSCGNQWYIQEGVTGSVFRSGSQQDLERAVREWVKDEGKLRAAP